MRGDLEHEVEQRTRELLELVGLPGHERRWSRRSRAGSSSASPSPARSRPPRVLLLDEPLGSLDRRLRDRLLDELERIFEELRVTALYVTHDQSEAFALGDRVADAQGRVAQIGAADELWARPADEDVARFLGLASARRPGRPARGRDASTRSRRSWRRCRPVGGPARSDRLIVVRLDDGRELEAAVSALQHPGRGDRVDVEIDPAGIVRLG